ncbi:hypothetical protein DFJ73DRAFT_772424 [Zopfochytrium polystomum]|nr:hypothetical protein DFJ73DRAFT_772424 [Zopfochytrium polystomum]
MPGVETSSPTANCPLPYSTTVLIDLSAAVVSAASVAPVISIVDKAIFANASGREKMGACLRNGFALLLTRPWQFVKQPSFLLIWGVYSGTYIVANSVETFCNYTSRPWFYPKFIASSFANVSLSVAKDLYFTRAFAKLAAPTASGPTAAGAATAVAMRPVPFRSYSLYTLRDTLTIFAGFNLPPLVAAALSTPSSASPNAPPPPLSPAAAAVVAQLVCPVAVQFVSTPLHLVGMDLYNRPTVATAKGDPSRAAFVAKEYLRTAAARCARIFPAYGVGGVLNTWCRKSAVGAAVRRQGDAVGGAHAQPAQPAQARSAFAAGGRQEPAGAGWSGGRVPQ